MILRIEPERGDRWEQTLAGDEAVIGRSASADIVIDHRSISRRHARIFRSPTGWSVEDLASSNGTFVNGSRITRPQTIADGDVIVLGSDVVRLLVVPDPAPAPAGREPLDSVLLCASAILEQDRGSSAGLNGEPDGIARYADRMRIVNEVHAALSRPGTVAELLDLILDRMFRYLRPQHGVIFLRDGDGWRRAASRTDVGTEAEFPDSRSL
ncbi:MAG: FHA domain-containing protein, partial [Candidatus Krumholzibacteriia bacterium]